MDGGKLGKKSGQSCYNEVTTMNLSKRCKSGTLSHNIFIVHDNSNSKNRRVCKWLTTLILNLFYVFVYGIFNEEVSISGSKGRVINKLERTWKEPIVA
jgi:hypothetical protein